MSNERPAQHEPHHPDYLYTRPEINPEGVDLPRPDTFSSIVDETIWHNMQGAYYEVKRKTSGWDLETALDAIEGGQADVVSRKPLDGDEFMMIPVQGRIMNRNSYEVKRYDDREFGDRIANQRLRVHGRPLRGSTQDSGE